MSRGPSLVLIIVLINDKANVTLNRLELESNPIGDEGRDALREVLGGSSYCMCVISSSFFVCVRLFLCPCTFSLSCFRQESPEHDTVIGTDIDVGHTSDMY